MRTGSAPNFCPPIEEGLVFELEDEDGDVVELEFLGLVLHEDRRFGFFFEVTEDEPAMSSGEVVVLEATALDEEGQPAEFTIIEDDDLVQEVFEEFKEAAKDLYDFE